MARSEVFSDMDQLKRYDRLRSDGKPKSLGSSVIKIEGMYKSGKSALGTDCPYATILHCPEGKLVSPFERAQVYEVPDYKTLQEMVGSFLEVAKKIRTKRGPRMMFFDPLKIIEQWLIADEVARYNRVQRRKLDMEIEAGEATEEQWKYIKAKHIADVREYGTWDRIGSAMRELFLPFTGYGWGVGLIVHYKKKMLPFEGGRPGGTAWLPEISPSLDSEINKFIDVRIVASKDVVASDSGRAQTSYRLEFESAKSDEIGSRVPLRGSVEVPNYFDKREIAGVSAWTKLEQAYALGIKRLEIHKTRHSKARRK